MKSESGPRRYGTGSITGGAIWRRSACTPNFRSRIAFMFLSKLYRQMYAGTGISTDSARRKKSKSWARWTARQCKRLFQATPMPELKSPVWELAFPSAPLRPALGGDGRGPDGGPFVVLPEE